MAEEQEKPEKQESQAEKLIVAFVNSASRSIPADDGRKSANGSSLGCSSDEAVAGEVNRELRKENREMRSLLAKALKVSQELSLKQQESLDRVVAKQFDPPAQVVTCCHDLFQLIR
jgi:hypothetical protein